jgi:hypothetical protein
MNRRFANTIIKKKSNFELEEERKRTLAESFLDSLATTSLLEADTAPEISERLQQHKEHLIETIKKVAKEGIQKLEDIHGDEECLSDDELFDPNKPLLATAVLHSALEAHTFGSPAWDSKEKRSKKEEQEEPKADETTETSDTNGTDNNTSDGSDLESVKDQINNLG